MKKSFYLMLLCIIWMFSSCSQTEELSGTDNQKSVQFSVSADGSMKTRATVITRYIMEVYESATPSSEAKQHIEQSSGNFNIILKDGVTYSFLFWADYGTPNDNTDGEYNAADLKAATILKQPTNAAWAGKVSFTKGEEGDDAYNVKLTHAVAEVNFIQSEDFTKAANKLEVVFSQTYSLNVADGSVTEIKKDDASVPATYTFTTTTKEAQTIGTSYIIAKTVSESDNGKTVINLAATLNNEKEHNVDNVPFAANYKTNITGAYSNLYNCNAKITCNDKWDETDSNNDLVTSKTYAVGDAYPDATNPIGVVFDTSDGGVHGKIVSLDESSSELQWSSSNEETGATSNDDGLANMATIQSYISVNSKSWSDYPASNYVNGLNGDSQVTYTSGAKGVWYLPAINELYTLCGEKLATVSTVNVTLGNINGAQKIETDRVYSSYWSSTKREGKDVLYLEFAYRDILPGDKVANARVRAVLAF